MSGPMGLVATAEQEALTEATALAAVARHGARRRCHEVCTGTVRCAHLRWAWRWILGQV